MIYLFLQALFASFFGLCIKWVYNREREDIVTIGALNYIVAALAALPSFLLANNISELSVGAMWTGGAMGGIYFIAFFFVIYCVLWVGASASTVVSVLSILMPIGFAAWYWNDIPDSKQVYGIALALLALLLMGLRAKGTGKKAIPWFAPIVLVTFFLLCGLSRIAIEAFKHVSTPEHKPTFLLIAFIVASIPSIAVLVYRKKKILGTELRFGIALGLSNILQSFFILKALQYYPGFIVFPVVSAGGIVITTLVATQLLGEKLNQRTYVGIAIAVVSLFLLHSGAETPVAPDQSPVKTANLRNP